MSLVTDGGVRDESTMIGRTLGDAYRVTAELGVGAMGVVYEAEQVRLKRTVAVKILADKFRENVSALMRFHNEARALVMLEHPHIVRIIDFATTADGLPYLVMERLHGNTVGNYLESGRRFSLANTLVIARQVSEALVEAHSKGIFHRDLKPDNLFLVEAPGAPVFVKVLDFGISRLPESEGPRVTSQSEVIGTPEYMSPEQALGLGDRINGGADQYALALVMYEMLSGVSPFASDDVQATLEKVSFEMPALLHTLAPAVPPRLSHVLHRALSKDPQERYAGIDAFMTAAQTAVGDDGPLSVIPRDLVAASMPVARTFSADDPVRTISLLLAQARRASLADDTVLSTVLATTALDAAALSDDEAIQAVVEMARPLLEGIFTARLEPIERRVFVRPPSAAARRDFSDAQKSLMAASKPHTTIGEILHAVPLPRLEALRTLLDLEALGAIEFRVGAPRPRNSIIKSSRPAAPESIPVPVVMRGLRKV